MGFTFDRSQPGTWLSGGAHVLLLAAGIVTFASEKLPDAEEGIPVEVITDNQLSQITKGEQTATEVKPDQKPRVDKLADTPVQRDPGDNKTDAPSPPKRPADLKLAEEEVEPAPTPPPMPPSRPEPSRAEQQKAEKAAADRKAAEEKKAEEKKIAEEKRLEEIQDRKDAEEQARIAKAKADQAKKAEEAKAKAEEQKRVAAAKAEADRKAKEALEARLKEIEEKQEADAKAKAAEQKKKLAEQKRKEEREAKARKQAELADKFSPGDINKVLTSHEPTRAAGSTGREVQKTASLGTATGSAQRLNPSQRDQIMGLIREQLVRCWQPPVALQTAPKAPVAVIRIALGQDGSLTSEPRLMNSSSDPLFHPVADSALRATRRCAPLRIPAQFQPFYADWRDIIVNFDPREMG